jgi:geranyl-CoA carboxylase alpha subunit
VGAEGGRRRVSRPFTKLLVANRGEIAVRVIRSARALGYPTVAVFSEADADAPHVAAADQAVCIGPPPPRESYLDIDRIVDACRRTGADALHPGYGFLSEREELARRCDEAGIAFVGPPADAIRVMGDKVQAKRRMIEAGVPTAPGTTWAASDAALGTDQDEARLRAEADAIGFPLLVKAVAGGGGRGMRIVRDAASLGDALRGARSEAASAFGNGDVFLEKLIEGARHVEIQVLADAHGHTIHLGERECSVQRRHQKIVEEAPSPVVGDELRARMGAAAVAAARSIGYVGAGTVEFLLDDRGEFHFLEMNTRLQVEHPVTEMTTGLDLVAWQLRIAAGEPLAVAQDDVRLAGHAIEARVYAEDPYAGFLPQVGRILLYRPAAGEGVRVDGGVASGQAVTPYYDPMIAKVVAHGETREVARRRLIAALRDTIVLGPTTNRAFLLELLGDDAFAHARIKTDTLDHAWTERLASVPDVPVEAWALAAVLSSCGPAEGWRSTGEAAWPLRLVHGDTALELRVAARGADRWAVVAGERTLELAILADAGGRLLVEVDGLREHAWWACGDEGVIVDWRGRALAFREPIATASADAGGGDGHVRAPMGGRVVAVDVAAGARVERGQPLAVLEAMKMEHRIASPIAGVVDKIMVTPGEQIAARQLVAVVRADELSEEKA